MTKGLAAFSSFGFVIVSCFVVIPLISQKMSKGLRIEGRRANGPRLA